MTLVPIALALATSVAYSAQDGDEARLARADDLLHRTEEGEVRRGAELCAEIDSAASVELLLGVFDETLRRPGRALPPPHYRDVVWEALIKIRDPYARKRVEEELKNNKRNAFVRQWCAELLGIYADAGFGPSLKKALADKDVGVRRAAARSLGMVGDDGAAGPLGKLVKHKDIYLRANALESLARLDRDTWGKNLRQSIAKDKDGGVRCALLGAAFEIFAQDEVERLSVAALEDDDWRPRMQAVDNLARIRTRSSVDALIRAVEDGRPVVGVRAVESLQVLTDQKHTRVEAWRKWWEDKRESFSFPEGSTGTADAGDERSRAVYNGIRLVSDHVAFLLDKSKAMGDTLSSRGTSKEEASRQELEQVLTQLQDQSLIFNVFTYELEVEAFEDEPLELTPKSAGKALEFVDDQRIQGSKDIWQVLEVVVVDPSLDTAYLLSSGEPDTGLYVHWNRVTRHLKDLNRFHKVVVHAIAYSDNKWYRDQLEKIANATGGEFQFFE